MFSCISCVINCLTFYVTVVPEKVQHFYVSFSLNEKENVLLFLRHVHMNVLIEYIFINCEINSCYHIWNKKTTNLSSCRSNAFYITYTVHQDKPWLDQLSLQSYWRCSCITLISLSVF